MEEGEMSGDPDWLQHDHREFGQRLFECQAAVEREDWREAKRRFGALSADLRLHLVMEDEVLYPAYEAAAGTPGGPTATLREDHAEIVRLLRDLPAVLRTEEPEPVLASLIALESVMLRHHEKEEEIFLPMAGYTLFADRERILRRLEEFERARDDDPKDP